MMEQNKPKENETLEMLKKMKELMVDTMQPVNIHSEHPRNSNA